MGRFHDELVQARRDGTAPPQQAEQEPEEAPLPPQIRFDKSSIPGAWVCQACWSLVDGLTTAAHADVHYRSGG